MINVSPCTACTLSCNAHPTCVRNTVCRLGCTECTVGCTECSNITCQACTIGCTFPTCAVGGSIVCACSHLITCGCTAITCGFCTNCTALTCFCTVNRITHLPAEDDPQASLQALSALKQQLRQQLAELETQEQAINAALKPQTVTQVDQLMQKLQEAIDDLKTQRAELAKKEAQEK